jgi:cyclophilin family peptidyl-prolyl cis-trans isomerase
MRAISSDVALVSFVLMGVAGWAGGAACAGAPPPAPEYAEETGEEAVVTDATPQEVAEGTAALAATPPPSAGGTVVRIETSMGTIRARLDAEHAPVSVANFLQYVRAGFYDGTIFHRVIDGFMIQGGGFDPGMVRKATREPIILEVSPALTHTDGALAMARTNAPNSATAQFYLCDGPQPRLDGQYAVFGQVIDGMPVVRAIASAPTVANDVPQLDVIIRSIRVE